MDFRRTPPSQSPSSSTSSELESISARRVGKSRWATWAGAGLLAISLSASAADLDDWWIYVRNDHWHRIEPLIQAGADPNRVSPTGQPTLVEAVRTKAWKTYAALLKNPKINIEVTNKEGENALMLLSVLGETSRVKSLLDQGAQVNKLGWTPLHYAASRNRLDVAKLLIARHAMINAPAPDGTTPLMMAALSKSPEMVQLLLSAGADPTTRNLSDLSAGDWARSAGADKLADTLDAAARQAVQQRTGAAGSASGGQAGERSGEAAVDQTAPSAATSASTGSSTGTVTPTRGSTATGEPNNDTRQGDAVRGVSGVRLGTYD